MRQTALAMASSATAAPAPLAEPALLGATALIGNDVRNQKNEDLGRIDEIMLDASSGKVRYAVLSCGGFFGIGDRQFAVPWNALKLEPANKRFVLDVDVDHLRPAPGFDKDQWPNMSDSKWATGIHSYYGARAHASRSRTEQQRPSNAEKLAASMPIRRHGCRATSSEAPLNANASAAMWYGEPTAPRESGKLLITSAQGSVQTTPGAEHENFISD